MQVVRTICEAFAQGLLVQVELLSCMLRFTLLETVVCLFLVKNIQITVRQVKLDDG